MADQKPESAIEKLNREVTLSLRAVGARVFLSNADPKNTSRCVIEVKCWWSPGLRAMSDIDIRIGDDAHKPFKWDESGVQIADEEADEVAGWSLFDCPVALSIYRAEDGWLADVAAGDQDNPILGRLNYYAPIQTADGVVNDKRPTVHAWVALGHENFQLLRDRVVATEVPDFDLGITVEFPTGTVETGWVDKKVAWDGKGPLPVSSAIIVWKRGDWDSKADRVRSVYRDPEFEEQNPSSEHIELIQAMSRLEALLVKLSFPLWIAVGVLIVAIVLRR